MAKAEFDPSKPFERVETERPEFDPNKPFETPKKAAMDVLMPNPSGSGQAFLEHYGNTAMMGYLPHAQALAEKVMPDPNSSLDEKLRAQGFNIEQQDGSYIESRDENLKRLRQQSEEHPYASGAGDVAGIVGGALLAGKALPIGNAPTFGGRALNAAKTGATMGAVANPGDTENEVDPLQLGARFDNAKKGALLGAAVQGGVEGAGRIGDVLSRWFRHKANEKALVAAGAKLRDFRKAYDKNKVDEIGRTLLDEEIVTPFATPTKIAERSEAALGRKGQEIDDILQELGEAESKINAGSQPGLVRPGQVPSGARAGVDRRAIAQSLREDLVNPNLDIPGVAAQNEKIEALIRQFENGADDLIPLLKAEQLKRSVGKEIKWDRLPGADIPTEEQVQRALYGKLRTGVEDAATALEGMAGGPNVGRFREAKNAYGALDTAAKIAQEKVARNAANRAIGLTDTISGGAGATVGTMMGGPIGGVIGTAVGAGTNKLGRAIGPSLMATGFDSTANALLKIPRFAEMAKSNPAAFQMAVNRISDRMGGGPSFEEGGSQFLRNPQIIEYFKKRPELIDTIKNEKLRAEIQKRIGGRDPAQHSSQPRVPEKQAQKQFLMGN